jgi:hypothetical protein
MFDNWDNERAYYFLWERVKNLVSERKSSPVEDWIYNSICTGEKLIRLILDNKMTCAD